MQRDLIQNWWLLHIRGIMAVLFGLFLMYLAGTMQGVFTTSIAMVAVLIAFMFYVIASTVMTIVAAIKAYDQPHKFAALGIHGLLLLVFSLAIWFFEPITIDWLIWFMVATAVSSGVLEIALAQSLSSHLDASLLDVAGIISVISAVMLLLGRSLPSSLLVEGLGIYTLYYGGVFVLLSLRLRTMSAVSSQATKKEGRSH